MKEGILERPVFGEWDAKLGLTEGFAQQLDDPRRDPDHSVLQMVRSRTFGIFAGYGDQNLAEFFLEDMVRAITCAENDLVVLPVLLYGTAAPPLGLGIDLQRVVQALRAKFPGRPDSPARRNTTHQAATLAVESRRVRACAKRNLDKILSKGASPS